MPKGLDSCGLPGLGISTRRTGWAVMVSGVRRRSTNKRRTAGPTALTQSIPAVFFPWLSCVTRRTASMRAASDFMSSRCKLWTAFVLPQAWAR